jgi:drug/metabolite transporter (DMT)-like permease
VSALRYTTVVRAGLAASMHPVFLIGYLGLKGQPLSSFEWVGTFITVMGLFVAAAKDLLGGGQSSVIGDSLGLISAVCQVVVILNRHKIKKFVPLWQVRLIVHMNYFWYPKHASSHPICSMP